MTSKIVTEAGYYNGKFLKAGMSYDDEGVSEGGTAVPHAVDLDAMTKDELIAEAESRGVSVKSSDTKAEIVAAIKAAEAG